MRIIYQLLWEIDYLDGQIKEIEDKLKHGSDAWEEGTDHCAMAECDPSDQFLLGEELEKLQEERKRLVVELKEEIEDLE